MAEIQRIIKRISDGGAPVVIRVRENVERVIAEIFPHARGIVFADIGFCDPTYSGHPFHVVEGELDGTGPWRVGTAVIDTPDKGTRFWDEWRAWQKAKKKYDCTREAARQGILADMGFE